MTKLYHTDVFIPDFFRRMVANSGFNTLVWTRHAKQELLKEKYGRVTSADVPLSVAFSSWELIELEVLDDSIIKYVVRRPIDSVRSLVIVLRPEHNNLAHVITCWINLNHDTHKTLDRSKYATD